MQDLVFVAVLVVFFALTVLFVRACERIIGPDESGLTTPLPESVADAPVAA